MTSSSHISRAFTGRLTTASGTTSHPEASENPATYFGIAIATQNYSTSTIFTSPTTEISKSNCRSICSSTRFHCSPRYVATVLFALEHPRMITAVLLSESCRFSRLGGLFSSWWSFQRDLVFFPRSLHDVASTPSRLFRIFLYIIQDTI
jgi:hypothetical protein